MSNQRKIIVAKTDFAVASLQVFGVYETGSAAAERGYSMQKGDAEGGPRYMGECSSPLKSDEHGPISTSHALFEVARRRSATESRPMD